MPFGLSTVPPVSGRPTTTAAAAWSWVEKMLHDTQRTSAPSSDNVSISTPVWMVMCRLPMIRAPASGCLPSYRLRIAISPGISPSASRSSLRPNSARPRSATLNGTRPAALARSYACATLAVAICSSPSKGLASSPAPCYDDCSCLTPTAANRAGPFAARSAGIMRTRTCPKPAPVNTRVMCFSENPSHTWPICC